MMKSMPVIGLLFLSLLLSVNAIHSFGFSDEPIQITDVETPSFGYPEDNEKSSVAR